MLVLARESRGICQTDLARETQITQPTISKLEKGISSEPKKDLIKKISRVLKYPVDFFYQQGSWYPPTDPLYRKKSRVNKNSIKQNLATANIIEIGISKLMSNIEFIEPNLVDFDLDRHGSPKDAATYLRKYWKIPCGPIKDVTEVAENAGIFVINLDFGTELIDGFTIISNRCINPIAFINRNFPGDRTRLTLAHEIGHMVLHQYPTEEMEKEANEFAAEFLMPEEDIRGYFRGGLSLQKLASLKAYWKVSMQALVRRAYDLGCITKSTYSSWFQTFSRLGYRRSEPNPIDNEKPSLLKEVLDVHIEDLGYTKDDLCKVLCWSKKDLSLVYEDPSYLRVLR